MDQRRDGNIEPLLASARYSEWVAGALVALGVPRERIAAVSFGRERPFIPENTPRAVLNNRVTIRLANEEGAYRKRLISHSNGLRTKSTGMTARASAASADIKA